MRSVQRAWLALVGCVGLATSCRGTPRTETRAGDVIVTHVSVVPMDRPGALPDYTVVIRGDRIAAMAPSDAVDLAPGATVVDGRGKWLMPGLADMHVHIQHDRDLTLYVAAGVTLVRNMFGGERQLAWRAEIARGARLGPTLLTAGPIIDGDPPVWPGSVTLTEPAQAEAIVAAQQAKGYDFLKAYSRLPRAAYEALAAAAKRHGMALAGHVPTSVGLRGVLRARQRTIEHLDGWLLALAPGAAVADTAGVAERDRAALARLDPSGLPSLISEVIAAGVWNCPTLIVLARTAELGAAGASPPRLRWLDKVAPEAKLEWQAASAAAGDPAVAATARRANAWKAAILAVLAAAQAPILVGTDTGNPFVIPGEALHEEIELMVAAGVPRARVLRAATADVGRFLGTLNEVGVVTVGARADLILVATDPLTTPLPLVPEGVVLRGGWHPRSELEAKLASLTAPPAATADRWDGVPALVPEGERVQRAEYDLALGSSTVGAERLAVGHAGAQRVVVAQIVAELFGRLTVQYALRAGSAEVQVVAPFGTVALTGKVTGEVLQVTTTASGRPPQVRTARLPPGGLITVPGTGGLIALAARLDGMKLGDHRKLTALEINYLPTSAVVTLAYDVERRPDAAGNRVFALTTKLGAREVTGELVLDPAGLVVAATPGRPPGLRLQRRP
jgi:imidazolonepropionase-like amidohydrolase